MEKWVKRTVELGAGMFFTGKANPSVIPYYPQKTEVSEIEEYSFRLMTPERVGVSSGRILAILEAFESEKRANLHNLMIIKDGELICRASVPGYDSRIWHLSHSMSKTVTGMAVGMLVDDGLLSTSDRLVDLFPELYYREKRFADITVNHLLTMTSGVKFSEVGSVTETKWAKAFFESPTAFAAGAEFNYNSMNSYILALIVSRITGKSLSVFLEERLFSPLGITNYFWEKGPEGVEKGGWGLYLSAESWAKIGLMMLGGGVYDGKRILSSEWVKAATSTQVKTPDVIGKYDYGYQIWVSEEHEGAFLFNGMLGQDVWVYPKNNLVVVINSGNNELFQNSPALAIIERYLGCDLTDDLTESCFRGNHNDLRHKEENFFIRRHWIRPLPCHRGFGYSLGFFDKCPFPEEWGELVGRYHFVKNNCGVLPLIIRGMQNNLKGSIDGIAFEREGERLFFIYSEGGVQFKFEVGFYDFCDSILEYHGEKYLVRVIGEAMEDEDRNMLFKLEFIFPEMPNSRMMKFSFDEEGRLVFRLSEAPNHRIADTFLNEFSVMNPRIAFIFDLLERRVGRNFVKNKLAESFSPTLIGARIGADNYVAIMDEEREKLRAQEKSLKLVSSVIERFMHEEVEEEVENKSSFRSFISGIMERIKGKLPGGAQLPESTAEPLVLGESEFRERPKKRK